MKILSIETSCDDTGVAILEIRGNKSPSFKVLSNIISSQIEVHKKYGGVYPALAKREHQRNLIPVLMRALKQAKLLSPKSQTPNPNQIIKAKSQILKNIFNREEELYKKIIPFLRKYKKPDIDLISVTQGPGLEPCLWVGINFAKALSYFWNIPIVPVNHIESHILVNFFKLQIQRPFPAICLVVSGGHTQIILMKGIGKYKILGETRDDAAGECFDKCAKILGLGYPGGPEISKLAEGIIPKNIFPRPMILTKDYDFSFSGLKTAVLYYAQKNKELNKKQMSAEVQQAIIDVLVKKTIKAAKDHNTKTIILGGGVSANSELRSQFQSAVTRHCEEPQRRSNLNLIFPPENLSTDNAVMTAIAGYFHQKEKVSCEVGSHTIKAESNLRLG